MCTLSNFTAARRTWSSTPFSSISVVSAAVAAAITQPFFALPSPCLAPYICQGTQNWCTRETLLQYKYTQQHTHVQIVFIRIHT
uniref:Secreted protein n=1 Tax=Trichogramma kaykai TaxID=54128 RepID=A0ABD2XDV9_9HYME